MKHVFVLSPYHMSKTAIMPVVHPDMPDVIAAIRGGIMDENWLNFAAVRGDEPSDEWLNTAAMIALHAVPEDRMAATLYIDIDVTGKASEALHGEDLFAFVAHVAKAVDERRASIVADVEEDDDIAALTAVYFVHATEKQAPYVDALANCELAELFVVQSLFAAKTVVVHEENLGVPPDDAHPSLRSLRITLAPGAVDIISWNHWVTVC